MSSRKKTSTVLTVAALAFALNVAASPLFAVVITTGTGAGADAYILGPNNGSQGSNFGSAINVIAQDFSENSNYMSHLRFDVSSLTLGSFTSATLRLTSDHSLRAGTSFEIHGLNDSQNADGWGEGTITYSNAPGVTVIPTGLGSGDIDPLKTTFLGTATQAVSGGTVSFSGANLLAFLNTDTDGRATFIISDIGTSNGAALIWASDEHTTLAPPTLVFASGDSAPQGAGLISLDFNVAGSTNTQVGDMTAANGNADGLIFLGQTGAWNVAQFPNTGVGAPTNATVSVAGLLDGNGNATTVGFTYNTGGANYRAILNGTGSALRTDHVFLNDTAAGLSATGPVINWELTGLEPGGIYDLILFGQIGPQNESLFTIFGNPVINDSEFDGNVTGIVANALGKITGTHQVQGFFDSWNGLQIRQRASAPQAVPEPSTIALWAILGLVTVGWHVCRRQW